MLAPVTLFIHELIVLIENADVLKHKLEKVTGSLRFSRSLNF